MTFSKVSSSGSSSSCFIDNVILDLFLQYDFKSKLHIFNDMKNGYCHFVLSAIKILYFKKMFIYFLIKQLKDHLTGFGPYSTFSLGRPAHSLGIGTLMRGCSLVIISQHNLTERVVL